MDICADDIHRSQPEDVSSLLTNKLAVKYAHLREVESMRAIARAHQERNLADFEKALFDYKHGEPHTRTFSLPWTHPNPDLVSLIFRTFLGSYYPFSPRRALRYTP